PSGGCAMANLLWDPLDTVNLWSGLGPDELQALAAPDALPNRWGITVYRSRVRSRSARQTRVVRTPAEAPELAQVRDYLHTASLLQVERDIGQSPDNRFRVNYYVTRGFARLAHMMARNLSTPLAPQQAEITVIQVPEWPERAIYVAPGDDGRVITWVLGSDYYGEAKMGALRAAMHLMRNHRGGLGLHAASKLFALETPDGVMTRGALIFGLSGTGKTTISAADHGLAAPEGVSLLQDDIVMLLPSGYAYGTEESFYIKTDSVTQQPGLLQAAHVPVAIAENAWVTPEGDLDFDNWELTANGRAIIPRWAIPNTGRSIDLPHTDAVFFNTRRYDLPPIGRLTSPEQAAAFLMLGESTYTSADDPTRAGQAQRVVAFDPFILDEPHRQGEFFANFLRSHPDVQVYLLNTGRVGGMEQGVKITPDVTFQAVEAAMRGQVQWRHDAALGYDTAVSLPGVHLDAFDPYRIYGADTYRRMMAELTAERRAWLAQFTELDPAIRDALG
ncbi:MAG: phosphoenolpyruvate carboxykinase, partial [Chloroflexi bacterium]|nr:phosphoenolpyruvate carboxykinase [Chloroflexota bacterium]